jgi:septal ring factor EnvC (AmiA/AmiB activator)
LLTVSPSARCRLAAGALLAVALALAAGPAAAQRAPSGKEVAARQADLKELRTRIDGLRKEISAAESSRSEAADRLKDSERSISGTQRELRELGEEKSSLQASLRALAHESGALEKELAAQQARLERLLHNQYLRGSPDPLRLLLNGDDPNRIARDLHYLGAIAKARSDMLAQIETTLARKRALTAETAGRAAALAEVEARQKEKHARLLALRDERKTTLSKISTQIAAQKKEVGNLQRDEKRMTQLIDRLSKLLAERARAQREAARKAAREESARRATPSAKAPAGAGAAVENAHLPGATSGSFARLRGKLRLPVKGTVSNRFGAPRQEGSTWRGLFIRSAAGSEVKSIAAGNVVFADWMRGFGNLLIVDHGDAYLSIYGNNEALLKSVGDAVQGGDAIATVGNSGGNPESGLYFEIRHQGQPVDPMRWASLK